MRVFVAALAHETNSFSPIPANLASFEDGLLFRPRDNPTADPETAFVGYGDFARLARLHGHEVVLSLAAWAQPSGPTARVDYEALRDEILNDLARAAPVDFALFMLHGSQMAVGYDDCEGDILSRARAMLGSDTPIGALLDLHCNITDDMTSAATALVACKEYPHTDFPERAVELFDMIEGAAAGELRPVMVHRRVPMLSKFHTTREPVKSFISRIQQEEGEGGILSVSLAHGFLWADMADAGAGIIVVADGDRDVAADLAATLSPDYFALRSEIYDRYVSVEQALDHVEDAESGTIVVADVTDNPGGGAPGDSTFVLRAMLARGMSDAAVALIWDPVAVDLAFRAGVGAEFPMRIGGKMGRVSGDPLDVLARVTALAESPQQVGLEPDRPEAMGPSAAISVGGIDVVLNSRRQQVFSPQCFTELGIDPWAKRLLVVKSSQHFYAQFGDRAARVLYCDAPGTLSNDFTNVAFTKLKRPIWPLDDISFDGSFGCEARADKQRA